MALALQAVAEALYARIASHSAGAAARALLGADGAAGGAASVIAAHALNARALPATPFVAWRGGQVGGEALSLRTVTAVWWVYDQPLRGYARINAILAAIEAAYPYDAVAYGRTRVTLIGQEAADTTLGGLLMRPLQLAYTRRA